MTCKQQELRAHSPGGCKVPDQGAVGWVWGDHVWVHRWHLLSVSSRDRRDGEALWDLFCFRFEMVVSLCCCPGWP